MKSSREIPACVQIILSVEPFIAGCPGIVRGVYDPSGFGRSMEI